MTADQTDIQALAAKVAEAANILAGAKERHREARTAEINASNMVSAREKELAVVWYEPSPGVRFRGRLVDDAPRKLGDTWVTTVVMDGPSYGMWRAFGAAAKMADVRMSVPAAALFALHLETE